MTNDLTKRPFAEALDALNEEERATIRFIPTDDALVAYHAGELSPEEEEKVRHYLAHTPEAARFVAELDTFLGESEDESLRLSEEETRQGLKVLEGALKDEGSTPPAPPPVDEASPSLATVGTEGPWRLVAAGALLVAGTACVWGGIQYQQGRELLKSTQVRAYSPEVYSDYGRPPGQTRGWPKISQEEFEVYRLTPGQWYLDLLFDLPASAASYSNLRLEVLDRDEKTVLLMEGLEAGTSLHVRTSARRFKPGEYLARVEGFVHENSYPLGEFPLKIAAAEEGEK